MWLRQLCWRKSLWMFSGKWWFASKRILQAKKLLNTFRIMMFCVEDIFVEENDFEYFQDNDDLRLRQFCSRKSLWIYRDKNELQPRQFCMRKFLWIFSGFWWFASKTILRAKKFLNTFRIKMICVADNFAGEKVFEYFQDNDQLRLRQFCRRKSLWIFSG